ncbi:MAG: endonuclease NucS domain-containing protein [Pseudomonadota bacterium]
MQDAYPDWLRRAVPSEATFRTKLSELRRVESAYGDLDEHYDRDELVSLIETLTYAADDERQNSPNPSRLEINGPLRTNLASYKSAVQKYARFRQDVELEAARPTARQVETIDREELDRVFTLEADLQRALRGAIDQLEGGLVIIDGGTERSVPSGRIDIFARDPAGAKVVIELKAVKAPRDAVGQVLAYMGDVQAEGGGSVRGILVAPEFDDRAVSAASVVPALQLFTYSFLFSFTRRSR